LRTKSSLMTASLILISFITFLTHSHASTKVKSSERLELLRTATGASSGGSTSFERRLNAILDPKAEPERSVVAREDARVQQQAIDASLGEEAIYTTGVLQDEWLEDTLAEDEESEETEEELEGLGPLQSKVTAAEKDYQQARTEMYRDIDASLEEEAYPELPPYALGVEKKSKLAPSLAHNPFYFDPESEDTFQVHKPVIVSRLIQMGGFTSEQAQNLVDKANSPAELIIILMQDEDYYYGEALEFVNVG